MKPEESTPEAPLQNHSPSPEAWKARWDTFQLEEAETLDFDSGETLVPPSMKQSRELGVLVDQLPRLHAAREGDGELRVTSTLGQGGMGIVFLARQTTIGRDVAVKTIREDRRSTKASQELLREAWITGRLEHPNIIPVHSMGVDDMGCPLFVMKRVEGISWAHAIHEPDRLPEIFREDDLLDAHLNIFDDVCKAIHFANSRGILHRDIKPDNVMIGSFGEVYVVDWGIAVSLDEESSGQLPLARDADQPAGTPGYMAPEMAAGEGDALSARTDVFLLGALLHELITGTPRHRGPDFYTTLFAAYQCEPVEYGEDVPTELAAICNRATRRDPAERYSDAEVLRQEVVDYRRHSSSRQLVKELASPLEELEALAAQALDGDISLENAARAHGLFGQCRFGFEQALVIWSDNHSASRGKERALGAMLDFEIGRGNVLEADVLARDMDELSEAQSRRLEEARSRQAGRAKRLEQLEQIEHSFDLNVARKERARLAIALGLIWTVGSLCAGYMMRTGLVDLTYPRMIMFHIGMTTLVCIVTFILRPKIKLNVINQRLFGFVAIIIFSGIATRTMMYLLEVPPNKGIVLEILGYGMITLTLGVLVERPAILAGVIYVLAALGGIVTPTYTWEIFALANALAIGIMGYHWMYALEDLEPPEDRAS